MTSNASDQCNNTLFYILLSMDRVCALVCRIAMSVAVWAAHVRNTSTSPS